MGDTNLLSVLMREKKMTVQQAADHAGEMLRSLMDNFQAVKARLPSFNACLSLSSERSVDDDVRIFIESLESWMIGTIYWSFATQRYFGAEHEEVERTLIVKLKDSAVHES